VIVAGFSFVSGNSVPTIAGDWIVVHRHRVRLLQAPPPGFFLSDRHRVRLLQAPLPLGQVSLRVVATESSLYRHRRSVRIESGLRSGFLASARSVWRQLDPFPRLGSAPLPQLRPSSVKPARFVGSVSVKKNIVSIALLCTIFSIAAQQNSRVKQRSHCFYCFTVRKFFYRCYNIIREKKDYSCPFSLSPLSAATTLALSSSPWVLLRLLQAPSQC
jgi:hypothetical protein